MSIVLFVVYLLVGSYLLTIIPFVKQSGINKLVTIGLYWLKVAAGVAYGYYFQLPKQIKTSDTWRFFRESLVESQVLKTNPIRFFDDFYIAGYKEGYGNLFIGNHSFWNNLKSNTIIKMIAACNVLTNNSYYADVVLMNLLFVLGVIALYRFAKEALQVENEVLLLACCLVPSFLFWCSGLHKDGVLFTAISCSIWIFYQLLLKGFSVKRGAGLLLTLLFTFFLRNYILLILLLCFIPWWVTVQYKLKTARVFSISILLALMVFFATTYLPSGINLPNYIVVKQQEFKSLLGNSAISVPNLSPTVGSFLYYLPTAMDIAFLRPHLNELKNIAFYLAFAEEWGLIFLTIYVFLLKRKTSKSPTIECIWVIGILIIGFQLIAGYIVTFTGAIVRYRSLVLPFWGILLLYFYESKTRKIIPIVASDK